MSATTTTQQPSAEISVKVGELFILTERESLSAGYETVARYDESALELMGDLTEASAEARLSIGGSTQKAFQFKALREGETIVEFVARRPWSDQKSFVRSSALARVAPAG